RRPLNGGRGRHVAGGNPAAPIAPGRAGFPASPVAKPLGPAYLKSETRSHFSTDETPSDAGPTMPMSTNDKERSLAVFVDLENLAMGFQNQRKTKFDIQKVLERLVEKGK